MIESIKITNPLEETLELSLFEPEKSGFIIRSIEGLGPVKADVHMTESSTLDGSTDNGARLGTRNIVMSLLFIGTPTIEDTRLKSYKYWPIKQNITFEIETDNRHCYTVGRVESNTPTIFDKQEGCQISILCPNPYFKDSESTSSKSSSVDALFEFPFSNESIEYIGKNRVVNNKFRWTNKIFSVYILSDNRIEVQGDSANKDTLICVGNIRFDNTEVVKLSGCPVGGSSSTYSMFLSESIANPTPYSDSSDYGSGSVYAISNTPKTFYVWIKVNKDVHLNEVFYPVIRRAIYVDGNYVDYGENLLSEYTGLVDINGMQCTINSDGTYTFTGTAEDDIDLEISNLTNLTDGTYKMNGAPNINGCKLGILSMAGELVIYDEDDETGYVTFTRDSEHEYYSLHILIEAGTTLNEATFKPLIVDESESATEYEPHISAIDNGKMINLGEYKTDNLSTIYYTGDASTGISVNIHLTGDVTGLGLYDSLKNTSMMIRDNALIDLTGEGLQRGDDIIINTSKGEKSIQLLRSGQLTNILGCLDDPITWPQLIIGDNAFSVVASSGLQYVQYMITYKTLYEGV